MNGLNVIAVTVEPGMTFRSSSNRIPQVKRHSLANITEAWRGVATFRGGPLSSLKSSSSSALDFAARHEYLEKIQMAVIQLFHRKKLEEGELSTLQDHVRHFVKTEAGPLLYDYYKEKILLKGMSIIRECLKNETGYPLLQGLCDNWRHFYDEILPTLQAMLYPIKTKDLSIRQVTLLEFRDMVVLKLEIAGLLDTFSEELPKGCKQMLLVLQGVHESSTPSINFLLTEKLTARIIVPFLGTQGLYNGKPEPSIKANANTEIREKPRDKPEEESDSEPRQFPQRTSLVKNSKLFKSGNGLAFGNLLAPVVEHETGRRHSIQT